MKKRFKVIFLDIDGVLVTSTDLARASGEHATPSVECVQALNWLTATTGAGIVVSSSWRHGRLPLQETLRRWGVTGHYFGSTPILTLQFPRSPLVIAATREAEIVAVLSAFYSSIDTFVILDDELGAANLLTSNRLVQTTMRDGLTIYLAGCAAEILGVTTMPEEGAT